MPGTTPGREIRCAARQKSSQMSGFAVGAREFLPARASSWCRRLHPSPSTPDPVRPTSPDDHRAELRVRRGCRRQRRDLLLHRRPLGRHPCGGRLGAGADPALRERLSSWSTTTTNLFARLRRELTGVLVVPNTEHAGLAGARNSGIAAATGKVIAFLDDDATATRGARHPDPRRTATASSASAAALPRAGRPPGPAGSRRSSTGSSAAATAACRPSSHRCATSSGPTCRCGARPSTWSAGSLTRSAGSASTRPAVRRRSSASARLARFRAGVLLYDPSALVEHRVTTDRMQWTYFLRRCFAEGISKSVVATLAGTGAALESERAYVRRVLPAGWARDPARRARARRRWPGPERRDHRGCACRRCGIRAGGPGAADEHRVRSDVAGPGPAARPVDAQRLCARAGNSRQWSARCRLLDPSPRGFTTRQIGVDSRGTFTAVMLVASVAGLNLSSALLYLLPKLRHLGTTLRRADLPGHGTGRFARHRRRRPLVARQPLGGLAALHRGLPDLGHLHQPGRRADRAAPLRLGAARERSLRSREARTCSRSLPPGVGGTVSS